MWVWLRDVGVWSHVRDVDMGEFVRVRYVSSHAHVGVYAYSCSCEWSWRRMACYISHVFVYMISLYRRVFKITVSSVSNVSILYFSRAYVWHVCVCVTVSCVRNQRMYTLCWMNCNIGCMQSEHRTCSFSSMPGLFCHAVCYWFLCLVGSIQVVLAMRIRIMCDICVISTMFLHTWFLYIEEFLILPCPTCPPYQSYILVGIRADTFTDTVPCQVSKISVCIRYDGWAAYFGMLGMNMMRVRFRWSVDSVSRTYVRFVCLSIVVCAIIMFDYGQRAWFVRQDCFWLLVISMTSPCLPINTMIFFV